MRPRLLAFLAVGGIALAGVGWWVLGRTDGTGVGPVGKTAEPGEPVASSNDDTSGEAAQLVAEEARRDAATAAVAETERVAVERPALVGAARGSGRDLEEARVTWTKLSPAMDHAQFWWTQDARETVEGATVEAAFRDGRFVFDQPAAEPPEESVVWVTCLGFAGTRVEIDSDTGALDFDLEPADARRITVFDRNGDPLEDAEVIVRGLAPDVSPVGRSSENQRADRARRALLRTYRTDASGQALVAFVDGRFAIDAEHDGARSAMRIGLLDRDFALRVGPTFSAGGRVTLLPGTEIDPGQVWIECVAKQSYDGEDLGRVALGDDFTWTMPALPWVDCTQLVFQLHGGMASNRTMFASPPRPGGHVNVDFSDVALGGIFRVKVVDDEQAPIADAAAYARAPKDGGSWDGRWIRTDVDGVATFPGAGPGYVWVDVRADGFVAATDGSFQIDPGSEYSPITITLARAARIEGRCTFAGRARRGLRARFLDDLASAERDRSLSQSRGRHVRTRRGAGRHGPCARVLHGARFERVGGGRDVHDRRHADRARAARPVGRARARGRRTDGRPRGRRRGLRQLR